MTESAVLISGELGERGAEMPAVEWVATGGASVPVRVAVAAPLCSELVARVVPGVVRAVRGQPDRPGSGDSPEELKREPARGEPSASVRPVRARGLPAMQVLPSVARRGLEASR